ncbi:hormone-sensitive lipase-like protein [Labeo rohita]|uniref:Hormone-sensitive lipase-like protein n=1 Tax=Labeo rohita TaxID=84645 RepID=A0A498N9S9_LABRO|nr:hormone-sensitive lipase-like protein [Labeo rohita]
MHLYILSSRLSDMDHKDVFATLQLVCSDVILALNGCRSSSSNAGATDRLLGVMRQIQEHGRAVEPLITGFTAVYHHFDLDAQTPANGYRTLVKEEGGLSERFVQEYISMHKACFYGRCLGFQNYLKSWSKDMNVPILSVDYSLAPEAPFPRALEECFYAYCWALKNCHLLGSTAERVCLVGDSAGGNLCITVSMRAMSHGVRVPDGIVAAYPATLLTTDASPSRLLTLIDPLLPLSVLCKCIDAYAGTSCQTVQPAQQFDTLAALGQDTVKMLSNFAQGATNWFQTLLEPKATTSSNGPSPSEKKPQVQEYPESPQVQEYPENFEPLRSRCLVDMRTPCTPIMKNPFVSPLLSSDSLLKGLPPVHIVASALDALLDDSVMFAKKLRNMNQPVTLTVVEDLPHGFLSLLQLSKETQEASDICVKRIREVFQQEEPPADQRQAGSS